MSTARTEEERLFQRTEGSRKAERYHTKAPQEGKTGARMSFSSRTLVQPSSKSAPCVPSPETEREMNCSLEMKACRSVAVKRHHDQDNSHERKRLIGGMLNVLEG